MKRCELCEKVKPGVVDGVCPSCARWAAQVDKMAEVADTDPRWEAILRDVEAE